MTDNVVEEAGIGPGSSNSSTPDVQQQMLDMMKALQQSQTDMARAFTTLIKRDNPEPGETSSKRAKICTTSANRSTSSADQSTSSANQSSSGAKHVNFPDDSQVVGEPQFVDPEIEHLLNTSPAYSFSEGSGDENAPEHAPKDSLLKTISENL